MSATKRCPQCDAEYDDEQRFCPRDGSTLRRLDPAADLVGQVVADRYHVLRKLGEGGMGQVYLAEHVKIGRRSALKVMHPAMGADADAISRFNREATNASRISHPHVCAIYDFGETPEGLVWLAMEYVEGEPLTALVARTGALPAPRAAEIARQTAEAIAAAHDLGIVHRDLKPDNIMIARGRDGADVVKVVDFGIAKAGDAGAQKVTKTGLVVGTPEYMSPEQLAGDPVDGRSDIYALALVTFNMLTGALPFLSETVQEAMIMRLTDRPRTLAEAKPGVAWPAALQRGLDRALSRDAAARPASALDFARDLVAAVAEMPDATIAGAGTQIVAPPQGAAVPATRVAPAGPRASAASAPADLPAPPAALSRRRPLVAAIAAGAAVAVAAIAGALLFGARGDGAARTADRGAATASSLALAERAEPAGAAPSGDSTPTSAGDSSPLPSVSAPVSERTEPQAALRGGRRAQGAAADDRPAGGHPAGEAPAADPAAVRGELDAMKRVIDAALARAGTDALDEAARRELGQVARDADALLPRIASDADIDRVDARYFRATALGLLDDSSDETCALLGRIRGRAGRLVSAGEITQLYDAFCRSA